MASETHIFDPYCSLEIQTDMQVLVEEAARSLRSLRYADASLLERENFDTSESLVIDEETINLLAEIVSASDSHNDTPIAKPWSSIEVEMPLLRDDHELRMLRMYNRNEVHCGHSIVTSFRKEFDALDLPLPDDSWTTAEIADAVKIRSDLDNEFLSLGSETLAYLLDFVSSSDQEAWSSSPAPYQRASFEELVCDFALVHDRHVFQDPETISEALEIDPASVSGSSIDRGIFNAVQTALDEPLESSVAHPECIQISPAAEPSPLTALRSCRLTTPVMGIQSRQGSSDSAPRELRQESHAFSSGTLSDPDQDIAPLMESAGHMLQQVEDRLAAEALNELDTTLRVATHPLKSAALEDLWSSYSVRAEPQDRAFIMTKGYDITGLRAEVPRLERRLHWMPFDPSFGRVDLTEQLEPADHEEFLQLHGTNDYNVISAAALAPIIMDESEDIEMIQSETNVTTLGESDVHMEEVIDLSSSVRSNDNTKAQAMVPLKRRRSATPLEQLVSKRRRQYDAALVPSQVVKAEYGLSSFLQLHGRTWHPRLVADSEQQSLAPAFESPVDDVQGMIAVPQAPLSQLPPLTDQECQIVLTRHMLERHSLIHELERRLPRIRMVERNDLTLGPQQLREADITISPTVGLVLTTLQKLKQRPLPGQEQNIETVRMRLLRIARHYSKLILLISEDVDTTIRNVGHLQPDDCEEIAGASMWASVLDVQVQLIYCPGGELEVAARVCQLLCNSGDADICTLRVDESRHERLLRAMGLNSFAAQALLRTSADHGSRRDKSIFCGVKDVARGGEDRGLATTSAVTRLQKVVSQGWSQHEWSI